MEVQDFDICYAVQLRSSDENLGFNTANLC